MEPVRIDENELHRQNIDEHDTIWARIEQDAEERIDLLKRIEALERTLDTTGVRRL